MVLSSMYFRLSRVAFWLAAAAAAWALAGPGDRTRAAATIAVVAALLSLVLRVVGERAAPPVDAAEDAPQVTPLGRPALQEATDALRHVVRRAPSFDAALHAAARALRNELGALEFRVLEVREVGPAHALVAESIESQPGFHAVPHRVQLDTSALGEALRTQHEVARLPTAVVPVLGGGRVVAAIELGAIALVIEPEPLRELLRLARLTLSERAREDGWITAQAPQSATREHDAAKVERKTDLPAAIDHPPSPDSGMLAGSAKRPHPDRLRPQDLDDPRPQPPMPPGVTQPGQMLPQLKRQRRPGVTTGPGRAADAATEIGAVADVGAAGAADVLDAASLARLTELDPTGANRLLERVFRAFQASSTRLRLQGETARREGDLAGMRLVVHTLKSSSASVGALHLSRLCAQLETRIRTEEVLPPDADLDAMEAALDAALLAIGRMLESRA